MASSGDHGAVNPINTNWAEIERVFNEVLERPIAEREAFLIEVCAGDETLLREVESLLRAGAPGFLERPAIEVAARTLNINRSRLEAGRRLNHYSFISMIGVGATADVYRARDTKLNREVAIKVLPADFARNRARLSRFHREAQLLASLNHPHIAGIYGLEEDAEICGLALELVNGETLAERISRGPLPIPEAMVIARQIADALAAAHAKGIVHRDLKPANIKITPDGVVKVLDFGLAKAFLSDQKAAGHSVPTVLETQEHTIVGTVCYMSPEQARGKLVDKRTDTWALGCVLYEMLTGDIAFYGETTTDVIAKIASEDPDWSKLPGPTSDALRRLLRDCLQKDPDRRSGNPADALTAAQQQTEDASYVRSKQSLWPISIALIAVVLILAVVLREQRLPLISPQTVSAVIPPGVTVPGVSERLAPSVAAVATSAPLDKPAPQSVERFTIDLPTGWELAEGPGLAVAISADGTKLVFGARNGSSSRLFVTTGDLKSPTPMPDTEGALFPFLSPDGKSVAYSAFPGLIKKISIEGGPSQTLCSNLGPIVHGGTWGADGILIAAGNRLLHAPCTDSPQLVDGTDGRDYWGAQALPKERILYTKRNDFQIDFAETFIESVRTHQRKRVFANAFYAHYLTSGHLIYLAADTGTVQAVPFDLQREEVIGPAFPVLGQVLATTGIPEVQVSDEGTLAYVTRPAGASASLVWVDRNGSETPVAAPSMLYVTPRLSADGRKIALAKTVNSGALVSPIWDTSQNIPFPLRFDGLASSAVWTPDARRIIFQGAKDGESSLYSIGVEQNDAPEKLDASSPGPLQSASLRDAAFLKYNNQTTKNDIWIVGLGGGHSYPFLADNANKASAAFSPDGQWLAYCSDESGRWEVYVAPFPGPGERTRVSINGGSEIAWARDGRQLFFRDPTGMMMAVDLTVQDGLKVNATHSLFRTNMYLRATIAADYDVGPDSRFLMVKNPHVPATQIQIVRNWFRELKQLLPSGH